MKTTLRTDLSVADVCNGFVYNELEGKGLFGLGGRLTIQPEYQRNYIYAEGGGKRDRRGRRRRTGRDLDAGRRWFESITPHQQ